MLKDFKERYTPDSSEIIKAESIFLNSYHLLDETLQCSHSDETAKVFHRYKRQFFGYINKDNEKKIVIQLIDNSKPRAVKGILGEKWEENFVNHFSDSPVIKILIYDIKLEQAKLGRM